MSPSPARLAIVRHGPDSSKEGDLAIHSAMMAIEDARSGGLGEIDQDAFDGFMTACDEIERMEAVGARRVEDGGRADRGARADQ